jgi:hypothetical protein
MTWQNEIWELQDATICKVIGIDLNVKNLRRIFRKFGLRSQDSQLDEKFVIHYAIFRTCGEENNQWRFNAKSEGRSSLADFNVL